MGYLSLIPGAGAICELACQYIILILHENVPNNGMLSQEKVTQTDKYFFDKLFAEFVFIIHVSSLFNSLF